ncbi:hypothetical protein [Pseudomonas gingeri]|uniref:Uncharacterized protein n=1 Tax=Pseudomonas gingeri TaxID=117681 RepID=A0A7Y8BTC3_9PSED|nr:hypothetical protein [Pseudomonas gingeri]NWB87154.1 hypothetical protein [Pseudomonas gingeri]
MNAKKTFKSPGNATGSITAHIVEGHPKFEFSSVEVNYFSDFTNRFIGLDKDINFVSIDPNDVSGPGKYAVGFRKPVDIHFSIGEPFVNFAESGEIIFESYVEGQQAKGTFNVVLFSTGQHVHGAFEIKKK